MALRPQVDPYVLIGDSMADLPSPAEQKQGILFHEHATGECRVLVIDPATGVRTWEPWCTNPTGPSGETLLYKFSGGRVFSASEAATRYLADETAEDASGVTVQTGTVVPQRFLVPIPTTFLRLRAFVRFNTLVQASSLALLKNGTLLLASVPVAAGVTGAVSLDLPVAFAVGDSIDVGLTLSPLETAGRRLEASAIVLLQ